MGGVHRGAEDWRIVRLGDVCDIQLGKMLSPKSRQRLRPRPYLRNANVKWGGFDLSDIAEMDFTPTEEEKFELRPDDLLVCEGGEPGRAAVWDGSLFPCYYQKALHRLRPLNGAVDPHFLMYRLWLAARAGEFEDSHARTTIAHLPAVRLAQLRIKIPAIREQRRIAALLKEDLAAVQRARAAAAEQLAAAEALAGAYLRNTFYGIIPLSIEEHPRDTPVGWAWKLLKDLARLESGHTPSRSRSDWWNGEIPWIALPDIRGLDGQVVYDTREHTNEGGIANSAARVLPAGTVVLSRTASVGFVTVMGKPMATSQDFVNWVCGPKLDPYFLALLLRASRSYIRSLASGAVHPTVYVPTVRRFSVCVPQLSQQRSIVRQVNVQLATTARLQHAVRQQFADIDALPNALLRHALSEGS